MAKENEGQPQFTLADVMAIVQQMSEANRQATLEAVKELRKPNEFEQKKLDDEKARREKAAKDAVEQAKLDEKFRAGRKASCTHKKKDGRTRWGGQVNGDGYIRFHCNSCHDVLPKVKAPIEWATGGVNTHLSIEDSGGMALITKDNILGWHAATVDECTDQDCRAAGQHRAYRIKHGAEVAQ